MSTNLAAILLLVISASCLVDVSHCVKRVQEVTWAGRSLAEEQDLPEKPALNASTPSQNVFAGNSIHVPAVDVLHQLLDIVPSGIVKITMNDLLSSKESGGL